MLYGNSKKSGNGTDVFVLTVIKDDAFESYKYKKLYEKLKVEYVIDIARVYATDQIWKFFKAHPKEGNRQ